MVLQNLKHILPLPGIIPPGHAILRVRRLLLLEQGIVHAAEERRTQQPLLALRRIARRSRSIEPGPCRLRDYVYQQASTCVCDGVIAITCRTELPLLSRSSSARILYD